MLYCDRVARSRRNNETIHTQDLFANMAVDTSVIASLDRHKNVSDQRSEKSSVRESLQSFYKARIFVNDHALALASKRKR